MNILDIDLDFFLSDIVSGPCRTGRGRPNKRYYKPWSEYQVRRFLENRCKLSPEHPLQGKSVVEHDAVLLDWREKILSGRIVPPFTVFHIDAHADLGMGDSAYMYLATDLIGKPVEDRLYPKKDKWQGLLSGNYLLFAIACRWLNHLAYIHHPRGGNDVPGHIMKDHSLSSGRIQLKYYGKATLDTIISPTSVPILLEPEVGFEKISGDDFQAQQPFDMVYLAQSPQNSPHSSDALMDVIREYMDTRSPNDFVQLAAGRS